MEERAMRGNDKSGGHGAQSFKRCNWRQQQVIEQLGESAQSRHPSSRSVTPPFRIPMTAQPRIAPLKLHFVVVGGSLGGLSVAYSLARSGHCVHVVERKDRLVKDSCGIRIPPNLARILDRWGLGTEFKNSAILCKQLTFRKLCTAEVLGCLEYKEEVMKVLEADFWLMHYADLLAKMYELAISAGAVVQFSSDVIDIDPSTPTVTLSTGEVLKPDVVIGADGYHSLCQKVIEGDVIADGGEPIEHISSGTVVYSMNADVSDVTLENDPELYGFIKKPVWTAFAGPHVSVLTWPSRSYKEFSIQIFNPDVPNTDDTWDVRVPIKKIDTTGFPRILLELTRRCATAVETKFVKRRIEDWVHPDGKLVLLGESAHPQIPSSTHSGSLAVEDAAVLGAIFSRLRAREQIQPFLSAYEELRVQRCWDIQQSESANSASVMLPDGPAQQARDESMRAAAARASGGWDEAMFCHLWEDIRILFAYDPEEDAEEWWQAWGLLRERAEESRADEAKERQRRKSAKGHAVREGRTRTQTDGSNDASVSCSEDGGVTDSDEELRRSPYAVHVYIESSHSSDGSTSTLAGI